ncbi:ribonuclease H-like domain-containing protein [Tanacetum coccineum]
MDLETAQTTTTAKLPILKQENGNSFKPVAQTTNTKGTLTTLIPGPVTTKEKLQKKNDVKARSMLLMALPNEHLMIFNQYKDAQTFFASIQTRFGGNEATKKTLLKQMYENFSAQSTESLDSIFNRLQKIRNKPDLDIMSFDDLYNNFKIVEQEVKTTTTSSSSSSSQNMAFVSSPSSTNEVNTAYGVSTASPQVNTASTQVSTANLSDATLALLSIRTRKFFQKTSKKITINANDTTGYDKSKVECYNCHKMGHFAKEYTSSKAMVAIDGVSFDWSYMAEDEAPTNMALMALSDYEPEFEGHGPKTSENVSNNISNEIRENIYAPLVEELVSDDKLEKKTVSPTVSKIEFVRPKQQQKPVRKPVKYVEMYRSQSPRGNKRNWNNQKSQQLGSEFVMYNKACFVCGSFDHVQAACNYHQRERMVTGNNYTRVNYNYTAKKAHPSAHKNRIPRAILMKTGLRPLNTARPVNTAHPKTIVYSAKPKSHFLEPTQSTIKRPIQMKTTLTNRKINQKVNTAKGKFYTAKSKAVNTATPNSAVVNVTSRNLMDDMLPLGMEQKEEELLVKEHLKLVEAVNTACYVQNRVLVVKPHNKTPYELFRGKFDGKSDEGFFVGYSLSSKASRVYNIRTKKVEENMHVEFLENKPMIAGDGPKWLFDIDSLTKLMNYVLVVADDSLFDSGDNRPQSSNDARKKDDENLSKEDGTGDHEMTEKENNTNDVNNAGLNINTASTNINTGSVNINIVSPLVNTVSSSSYQTQPEVSPLRENATYEATYDDFFGDEADITNITSSYTVLSTPNTRIHKDHLLDIVIGDVQSGLQQGE